MKAMCAWMAAGLTLAATIGPAMIAPAMARGGGAANIMSSPGYQRRLQESRGSVTTYSNGVPERGPLYQYRHRTRPNVNGYR